MSGGEILVILIVFLLLFGPDKIPGIARTLGKIMHQVNQVSSSLKEEIAKETDVLKDTDPLPPQKDKADEK